MVGFPTRPNTTTNPFFFFLNFQLCQTGDHQQEDLTKYGYRPDMKVKNYNHFVFWLLARCCRYPAISLKKFKSGKLGPFIPQKSIHVLKSYFSGQKVAKIHLK